MSKKQIKQRQKIKTSFIVTLVKLKLKYRTRLRLWRITNLVCVQSMTWICFGCSRVLNLSTSPYTYLSRCLPPEMVKGESLPSVVAGEDKRHKQLAAGMSVEVSYSALSSFRWTVSTAVIILRNEQMVIKISTSLGFLMYFLTWH